MSIYSVFIYENHQLQEHRPGWMSAERYEYCDQINSITASGNGLFKNILLKVMMTNMINLTNI